MSTHIETHHDLECYFCSQPFRDFAELARHVKEECEGERGKHGNAESKKQTWEDFKREWNAPRPWRGLWRFSKFPQGVTYREAWSDRYSGNRRASGESEDRLLRRATPGQVEGTDLRYGTQIRQAKLCTALRPLREESRKVEGEKVPSGNQAPHEERLRRGRVTCPRVPVPAYYCGARGISLL